MRRKSLIALNKRNVPGRAIIAGTVFAYGAMLTSIFLPATGLFTWLVNASGTAMLFLYAMIGIAQIRYRNGLSPEAAAKLPIKMWLFPGLSYFAVLGIGSVLVAMGMIPDLQSQLTTTLLLILALLVIYFVFRRGRYVAAEASQA